MLPAKVLARLERTGKRVGGRKTTVVVQHAVAYFGGSRLFIWRVSRALLSRVYSRFAKLVCFSFCDFCHFISINNIITYMIFLFSIFHISMISLLI